MMAEAAASVLWQRLDSQGHDACRLLRRTSGWELAGTAVFLEEGNPCRLDYRLLCDLEWRTRSAAVEGWIGPRSVTLDLGVGEDGQWRLEGEPQPQCAGCLDLDLGFTPASNLLPLRRLALKLGAEAQAPAAYLSFPDLALFRLEQHYRRSGETSFAYAAPAFGYSAVLEVSATGFVLDYPGLWRAVASA